ncbi:unnamed protein product [Ceratitis capitata]|uniref:(Mediterranean fruit fly) hypothetical protein n=1 Tax=Ceratitis capitata TaxID=7213 RepID=A0A811V9U8_CERCA|nr:unnamed protein product [Ceratitis capitata]
MKVVSRTEAAEYRSRIFGLSELDLSTEKWLFACAALQLPISCYWRCNVFSLVSCVTNTQQSFALILSANECLNHSVGWWLRIRHGVVA